ncbi:MAG: hypothetical protein ACT6FE_07525 [Methanosarcinaceae archaeon]
MNNIFQKIANFIKYHNAFTISLLLVFLFSGVIFASDTARDAVIGEKIITKSGIDNTELLDTKLDNFDLQMTIIGIEEDDKKYYIEYTFNTLGIQNNIWQKIVSQPILTIYKDTLGDNNDLGLYITEKFSQIADYQISYLKEVQEAEIEKGKQQIVETTEYTGLYQSLIGKILDVKEKVLPGYEPVVVAPVIEPVFVPAPVLAPVPDPASCIPDWQCDEWSPSVDFTLLGQEFTQTRYCFDLNNCDINDNKPTEQQIACGTLFELTPPAPAPDSINCASFLIDGIEYVSVTFDGIEYFYEFCE